MTLSAALCSLRAQAAGNSGNPKSKIVLKAHWLLFCCKPGWFFLTASNPSQSSRARGLSYN
jgi:hypothetical protein